MHGKVFPILGAFGVEFELIVEQIFVSFALTHTGHLSERDNGFGGTKHAHCKENGVR